MFSQQTAPHRCSPSPSIHHHGIPPDREREAQTNSERKSLLAANPSLAGFSRTAVSNKESCLRKKRGGKKTQSTSRQFSTKERGCGGQGGMNDGEILLKSSNDRGQFLLTRRKRYNESTDWWILRFKSWLIGSKRIFRRLLRSVAWRQVLSSAGKCRILELKPKEQFSCILGISGRHSTQRPKLECFNTLDIIKCCLKLMTDFVLGGKKCKFLVILFQFRNSCTFCILLLSISLLFKYYLSILFLNCASFFPCLITFRIT